jgi:hypothetical protein
VRPQRSQTTVTIEYRTSAGSWRTLKTLKTTSTGVYALKTPRKRHYRVKWTAPSGTTFTGPSVSSY